MIIELCWACVKHSEYVCCVLRFYCGGGFCSDETEVDKQTALHSKPSIARYSEQSKAEQPPSSYRTLCRQMTHHPTPLSSFQLLHLTTPGPSPSRDRKDPVPYPYQPQPLNPILHVLHVTPARHRTAALSSAPHFPMTRRRPLTPRYDSIRYDVLFSRA